MSSLLIPRRVLPCLFSLPPTPLRAHGAAGGAQAEADMAEAAAAGRAPAAATGAWAEALRTTPPMLHAIDDLGAAEGGNRGTAHLVAETAEALGLGALFSLHEGDAYAMAAMSLGAAGSGGGAADGTTDTAADAAGSEGTGGPEARDLGPGGQGSPEAEQQQQLDVLWLDFGLGSGPRIEAFLDAWWPRLRPGGLLILHSTLTNAVTRAWLEKQRDRSRPGGGGTLDAAAEDEGPRDLARSRRQHLGAFECLSLLEPHKMYQNSCSIFQKRDGGWAEPVLTSYP